jgi:hypothetical protein
MSAPKDSEPRESQGVLSKLPRTRPQRASPRRAAARETSARAGASAKAPPVPRQGFECEGERASGPVQPPGGTELVASAAEIIGELAKAGLSTGERVLKDVLSRLPLS